MKLALAKCRDAGVAAVAVRNSGHFGAAGAYAAMAARAGLLGLATTSTRTPSVVPTFGVAAMLGTNPIALAAPAARHPAFLLDMATSTAPLGKLTMAERRGRSIPAGWALDPRGAPVTNPRLAAGHRRLTPLGGSPEMGSHKGYGLGAMVEILSAVLPGLWSGRRSPADATGVGHFFLAVDPRRFRDEGAFETDLDALIDSLHACERLDARTPVRVAGDPEYAACAERRAAGIPLTRSVVEDLRRICHGSGAPFLLDA
jgi:LDH2 family malate/lactate/ureidoglycolate dehydrogenase